MGLNKIRQFWPVQELCRTGRTFFEKERTGGQLILRNAIEKYLVNHTKYQSRSKPKLDAYDTPLP